jgi:predicted nuclease of predicted toxin-antitoxin system
VNALARRRSTAASTRETIGRGRCRAEHVEDLGLCDASDTAIWLHSLHKQAIIVTKDADFVEKFRRQPGGPLIVWLRIGNAANSVLLAWFLPVLQAIVARIQSGDRFIEVR